MKFWTMNQLIELENYARKRKVPDVVIEEVKKNLKILDTYYKPTRNAEQEDGGYVVIVKSQKEYDKILKKYHLEQSQIEFRDELCHTRLGTYYADLYIVSTEFAIVIIWMKRGDKK